MCHSFLHHASFWTFLLAVDRDIAEKAREDRCPHCEAALHSSHYRRKPRGAPTEGLSFEFCYRLSLCCGREGCRRRLTPPSVRFLGPKVYLGAVVVLATAMRQGPTPRGMRKLQALFGADRRTLSRWQEFWEETFPHSAFWTVAKARFMPAVAEKELPLSLLEAFEARSSEAKLKAALLFLSPITRPGGLTM